MHNGTHNFPRESSDLKIVRSPKKVVIRSGEQSPTRSTTAVGESDPPVIKDCWNQIGVKGDRSCNKLKNFIHCHDCPVYAAVGDSLLEREPPLNYVEEWSRILADMSVDEQDESDETVIRTTQAVSLTIFRIGQERLAFPVRILQEVTHPCVIQPLPHRSNELFLGLVNVRGEMLLCASLGHLLNLKPTQETSRSGANHTQRMIVAGQQENRWVFAVDEVYGIYRFDSQELRDAPVVITKAAQAYTKGIIYWQGEKVNYLDSELLFYTLNQKIL